MLYRAAASSNEIGSFIPVMAAGRLTDVAVPMITILNLFP